MAIATTSHRRQPIFHDLPSLTITDRHMEQFNTLLVEYYNTGESEALTDFLYENAIQGIT